MAAAEHPLPTLPGIIDSTAHTGDLAADKLLDQHQKLVLVLARH